MSKNAVLWNEKYFREPENQQFDKNTVKFLGKFIDCIEPKDRVLDLGCGIGQKSEYLKSKNLNACGIDSSLNAILYGKKKYKNIKNILGDALNLPFKKNKFGAVLSIAVWHCLLHKERIKLKQEIERILHRNGLIYQICLADEDKTLDLTNEVERNTYKQKSNLTFHLSTEKELKSFFRDFNIVKLKRINRKLNGKNNSIFLLVARKR